MASMVRSHGPVSMSWTYHDADGEPVGIILRWNQPGGKKDVRPVARHEDGWRLGGMPEPRPLYCLQDLAGADIAFITEGERAADAVRSIGLVATTSAHGSQSAGKSNWSSLAGKRVVVLPDRDDPGELYAETVTSILTSLDPQATVQVIRLPGLPEKGDMVEWLAAQPSPSDHDAVCAALLELVEAAEPVKPDVPTPATPVAPAVDQWRPFPVDALPEPLRSFVAEASMAIGCDPSYIALPVLSICGAAAGNKVRLEARYGYRVPPVLWTAIIGESGTSKSPALRAAMAPLHARQRAAMAAYDLEMIDFRVRKHLYDKQLAKWKRDPGGEPPDEPAMPRPVRCYVSDTTVEALIPILQANPNGTLMSADELATWFGGFDKYSSGKGSDAAQWLSMYDAGAVIVDRKHGIPPTLSVDSAAVCILGGIQPEVFRRALGAEHRQSGLAARLLTCTPPRTQRVWTEAIIDFETEQRYAACINAMYDIRFEGDTNNVQPHIFTMDREAKAAYIAFINEHGAEEMTMGGDLLASWSKLANIPLRLALIFHMVRLATGDRTISNADEVDAASMYDALALTRFRTLGELVDDSPDCRFVLRG